MFISESAMVLIERMRLPMFGIAISAGKWLNYERSTLITMDRVFKKRIKLEQPKFGYKYAMWF